MCICILKLLSFSFNSYINKEYIMFSVVPIMFIYSYLFLIPWKWFYFLNNASNHINIVSSHLDIFSFYDIKSIIIISLIISSVHLFRKTTNKGIVQLLLLFCSFRDKLENQVCRIGASYCEIFHLYLLLWEIFLLLCLR